ncbi:ABC transporter ATP-binding protein [Siminovitchia sp. 179-K 8D1 HS]|uniref:ABC transporter ATP-binding protein n=1 Tax=Siminovitchia sp. 179-K 8D1 HS TaxID=3142385 RepID=UPI00399F26EC
MNEALVFQHVSFAYDSDVQDPVLQDLSFSVKKGEFVSVVGPSGSGKSTLFRLISGLEKQNSGCIFVNGEEPSNRQGHVGYMSQKDGLLPWLSVVDNAALPLMLKRLNKKDVWPEVIDKLEVFGLKDVEHRYPHELSGGMRQRVSFLRALLGGSCLLLLDEPFSALDAVTKTVMHEWLLEQWADSGRTILFITHDVEEALFLSDRVLLFSQKPVSRLEEIPVPLGRPRTVENLKDPAFTELKEKILLDLRKLVTL